MRSRKRALSFENLERRELLYANAVLDAAGVLTINALPSGGAVDIYSDYGFVAAISSNQSNSYRAQDVDSIVFRGSNNSDHFENHTAIPSKAYGYGGWDILKGGGVTDRLYGGSGVDWIFGGDGRDILAGGSGTDYLFGEDGNDDLWGKQGTDFLFGGDGEDRLVGGDDNDTLKGENGRDWLYGEDGNDTLYGGRDRDILSGGNDNDVLEGGGGNDDLWGNEGNDTLRGQGENDRLWGGSHNDRLFGGAGIDQLWGGSHDDALYGGADLDYLFGESGNDGLFGGVGSRDVLDGGSDADRLLEFNNEEQIVGFENGINARIGFRNDNAFWTDNEIVAVDRALAILHQTTNDTELLRLSSGGQMDFYRQAGRGVGFNRGGDIYLTDYVLQNTTAVPADWVTGYTLHEIGHNWDNMRGEVESPIENQFLALSGWTQIMPTSGNYTVVQRYGETWFHRNNSNFASDYAMTHPVEDFAESFAAYFLQRANLGWYSSDGAGANAIPNKINLIHSWVATI